MKQIRIIAKADGTTKISVECGVVGQDCLSLTKPFETALGGDVVTDAHLPEMYQTEEQEQGQS